MNRSNDSTVDKVAKGLTIAAGAALGVVLGSLCIRPGDRGRGTALRNGPQIDTSPAVAELSDRLDRVEGRLSAVQDFLLPIESAVADLESRFQQYAKDFEALKAQASESETKEMDAEVARLGALFVEVEHPLLTSSSRLTH